MTEAGGLDAVLLFYFSFTHLKVGWIKKLQEYIWLFPVEVDVHICCCIFIYQVDI